MATMTAPTKKVFVYKRDKDRHHRLMERESDPFRPEPKPPSDKPPKRVEYNPDRSGLGKMEGGIKGSVKDQYRGIHEQQARIRQQALMNVAVDTIADDDPEFLAFLSSLKR